MSKTPFQTQPKKLKKNYIGQMSKTPFQTQPKTLKKNKNKVTKQ